MDRDRLKQVQQSDLTESRLNEDFVDWLKNKGPIYLSVAMLALAGYLAIMRWKDAKQQRVENAWTAFAEVQASDPQTIEEIANDSAYSGVFAIPHLARLAAADRYLRGVQLDQRVVPDPEAEDNSLTPEEREQYLQQADRLYQEVAAADDQTLRMTLHVLNALNGRASVAESRDDLEQARQLYEQAAQRAEALYPDLAAQSRQRAASIEEYAEVAVLPAQADMPLRPTPQRPDPVNIDDSLRDLLPPEITGGS